MWDVAGSGSARWKDFGLQLPLQQWLEEDDKLHEETAARTHSLELDQALRPQGRAGRQGQWMRNFEKAVLLQVLDTHWREHLAAMDLPAPGHPSARLRPEEPQAGVQARSVRDVSSAGAAHPSGSGRFLVRAEFQTEPEPIPAPRRPAPSALHFEHAEVSALAAGRGRGRRDRNVDARYPAERTRPFVREGRKVGRNEPCPCGSGKKYKHCHGQLD
jgi:preprotein translocase subunit SecA